MRSENLKLLFPPAIPLSFTSDSPLSIVNTKVQSTILPAPNGFWFLKSKVKDFIAMSSPRWDLLASIASMFVLALSGKAIGISLIDLPVFGSLITL